MDKQWNELARRILKEGRMEEPDEVRAKYVDTKLPAPAKFVIDHVFKFDQGNVSPIQFGKEVNYLKAFQEIFWIMIMKSNRLEDLHKMGIHFWDNWEYKDTGTIGKAYGYQVGLNAYPVKKSEVDMKLLDPNKKHKEDNGYIFLDQLDHAVHTVRNNKRSRRVFITLVNVLDLPEMGIYPCVWRTEILVDEKDRVCFKTGARSSDVCLGNVFNVVQYHGFQQMFAQVVGLEPGFLKFDMGNAHIYDRHIEGAERIIANEPLTVGKEAKLILPPSVKSIYDFKPEDLQMVNYDPVEKIKFVIAE